MITIQSNDGSVCDITSESVKNGQVADVRAESEAAQLNTQTAASEEAQKKPEKKSTPQSARENARYAAARRSAERERDREIQRAREDAEREIERRVAEAIERQNSEEKTQAQETGTGVSDGVGQELYKNADTSPVTLASLDRAQGEVSRVREIGERLTEERTKIALEGEIERVRGHFPEIKNLLDIVKLERYPEVKGMVERGYALSDAVRLAYEDVYIRRRTDAAAAQVRGELSTSHMKPTSPTSAFSHDVTEAQIRTYLSSVPGATRDSAIKAYQKYKIGTRKV